jgi:alpha(1,3/1,4) fucosyltransferase
LSTDAADIDRPVMKFASVLFHKQRRDEMFSPPPGANGGGLYFPFRQLRDAFAELGVRLATPDMNEGREVLFELHINARHRLPRVPCYAYLWEHPLTRPVNGNLRKLTRYRGVFTWNTALVDGRRIHELPIPNDLTPCPTPGFAERDLFCVLIAGNRALRWRSELALHESRLAVIRWFEEHAPDQFALYGHGWDRPPKPPGAFGRVMKRVHEWRLRLWPRPALRTYRGPIGSKDEVLQRAKFSICYENIRGGDGYITEKLFDCMIFGCLPVYIGASDVARRIPPDCFIDGDRFASPAELHRFLLSIDEAEFNRRRTVTMDFLRGEGAYPYGNEHFCRTLVQTIGADLGLSR